MRTGTNVGADGAGSVRTPRLLSVECAVYSPLTDSPWAFAYPLSVRPCSRHTRRWSVECSERDRDRYGRILAVCRVDAADVNAWMVELGWAVAYRKYSPDYASHETAAKAARRGVWRGDFVEPSRWRRGERLAAAAAGGAGDCRIKGNISQKGTRIYHVPGGAWYAKTRIDTANGERWFCTEAEARTAGWRRAKS